MQNLETRVHTNKAYESELAELKDRLSKMAKKVDDMIANAMSALMCDDVDLAKKTILMDRYVNQDEIEIDEMCLLLLAKRQPLAADLRLIALVLKMVTDIERIGDLAVSICERRVKMCKHQAVKVPQGVFEMGRKVKIMLNLSIDAFMESNANHAKKIIPLDDQVDDIYHELVTDLIVKMKENDQLIAPLIHVQAICKWLERIGDHCTNLAEDVVYMARGKDIRHRH